VTAELAQRSIRAIPPLKMAKTYEREHLEPISVVPPGFGRLHARAAGRRRLRFLRHGSDSSYSPNTSSSSILASRAFARPRAWRIDYWNRPQGFRNPILDPGLEPGPDPEPEP